MRRVLEDLKQKQEIENRKKQLEEPDQVEIFSDRQISKSITEADSVFQKNAINTSHGINTAPSVFDRGAVFKTK